MRTMAWVRPWTYPAQAEALFTDDRYAIVEAATKAGKTVGALIWLIEQTVQLRRGEATWWVAPLYAQSRIAYRRALRFLPRGTVHSDGEMTITLPNGATIFFKTAKDPDALYGEDVHAVVIDEASRCKAESWSAVRSTLTATKGRARIIGNVKGVQNWAYDLARKAEAGAPDWHHARITAYDAADAGIIDRAEIDDAKSMLPPDVFQELYLATPSDRSRMFAGTPDLITAGDVPAGGRVVRAWDFASTAAEPGKDPDWTVGVKLVQHGGLSYVTDVVRFRETPDRVIARFVAVATHDGCDQVVEQEPGSSGKLLVQALRTALAAGECPAQVHAASPTGDKETRAYMCAAAWSGDMVRVVDAAWTTDLLTEVELFPHAAHDDQADALVHAYNHLSGREYGAVRYRVPGT